MRVILFLILAALAGCYDDECDPGQHYAHGLCYATVDGGVSLDAVPDAP